MAQGEIVVWIHSVNRRNTKDQVSDVVSQSEGPDFDSTIWHSAPVCEFSLVSAASSHSTKTKSQWG